MAHVVAKKGYGINLNLYYTPRQPGYRVLRVEFDHLWWTEHPLNQCLYLHVRMGLANGTTGPILRATSQLDPFFETPDSHWHNPFRFTTMPWQKLLRRRQRAN